MENNEGFNIQEFIAKAMKKYGFDPAGIVAGAYRQGVIDLLIETQSIMENEKSLKTKKNNVLNPYIFRLCPTNHPVLGKIDR